MSAGKIMETNTCFLVSDQVSSTSLVVDADGNKVAETRYTPFGEVRYTWGSMPTDKTYTGQRSEDFGLMDYNARYYDPLLGKFISADTIIPEPGNPLAWDRYGYAYNNPIMFSDPSGHFTEDAITDYLLNYFSGDEEAALRTLQLWKQDKEWWGMLTKAVAGDVLFGTSQFGPTNSPVHFKFNGESNEKLDGIVLTNETGEHEISDSMNMITLTDLFDKDFLLPYHASVVSFQWGGLLSFSEGNSMPNVYYRESITTITYFSEDQVKNDDITKGVIFFTMTFPISLFVPDLPAALSFGFGILEIYAGSKLDFPGWDDYGRRYHDKYLDVGGYEFVYRLDEFSDNYYLIYLSGMEGQFVPAFH